MKRLLSNKGNLLFTTAMCLVVAMIGFSLLTLVAATKERSGNYSEALYERYTRESFGRIAVAELVKQLDSAESNMQFSPLEESRDIQLHLQEALISTYLTDSNKWKYGEVLPSTITSAKTEISLVLNDLNTLLIGDLDLQHTQVLDLSGISITVIMNDYEYYAHLNGLRLVYTFSSNKVHCRYNTDNVTLSDTRLIRSTRRTYA